MLENNSCKAPFNCDQENISEEKSLLEENAKKGPFAKSFMASSISTDILSPIDMMQLEYATSFIHR